VTKASVTLVWDNTDKSRSHIDYSDYDEISVIRTIDMNKGCAVKNYINSKVSSKEDIKNFFKGVMLNVDNPHFLIMQGRITKVINMKPLDTLHMIEEAAGTAMYQEKKLKAEKTIK
jgi:structural maintenance of chromosome 2